MSPSTNSFRFRPAICVPLKSCPRPSRHGRRGGKDGRSKKRRAPERHGNMLHSRQKPPTARTEESEMFPHRAGASPHHLTLQACGADDASYMEMESPRAVVDCAVPCRLLSASAPMSTCLSHRNYVRYMTLFG